MRYCVWIYSKLEPKTDAVEVPPRQKPKVENLGSAAIGLEELRTEATDEATFRGGNQFPR